MDSVWSSQGPEVLLRVLVVEDDPELRRVIAGSLREQGMAVDEAPDGAVALEKAGVNDYDVVVLDRDLPVVHGDDVCRHLVEVPEAPRILMLTAAGSTEELVEGLAIGADDYLSKPYRLPELVARLKALGRRSQPASPPVLRHGDLVLDPARREVTRADRSIRLTPKEFGVLEVLLAADHRVVSSEELLEKVWDEYADPFTNAIRITVMTLRKKLGEPAVIETVTGVGYRVAD